MPLPMKAVYVLSANAVCCLLSCPTTLEDYSSITLILPLSAYVFSDYPDVCVLFFYSAWLLLIYPSSSSIHFSSEEYFQKASPVGKIPLLNMPTASCISWLLHLVPLSTLSRHAPTQSDHVYCGLLQAALTLPMLAPHIYNKLPPS